MEHEPAVPLPVWLERQLPPGASRYRVEVGGQRMSVMEIGEGRPVLMLHGNPTWGFLYRKVAAALSDAPVRLVIPDLIGLGFSDKPRRLEEHTLENHAAWIGRLIDELDLEGLVLVGQDWGGPVGLRALADRRDRLHGMVILNTVVGPPRPGFRPTPFHRLSHMPGLSDLLFRGLGLPQHALFFAQGDRRSIRGEVARAYRYPLRRRRDRAAPLALARMAPDSMEHPSVEPLTRCQELVESFEGPVEVVWGERDPILGRVIRHIEKLLPRANVTRTSAGHFLQEEVPDEIAAAIRAVAL